METSSAEVMAVSGLPVGTQAKPRPSLATPFSTVGVGEKKRSPPPPLTPSHASLLKNCSFKKCASNLVLVLPAPSGGARAAAAEEGHRDPSRRPAAHPQGDHRDPFLRRPAQGIDAAGRAPHMFEAFSPQSRNPARTAGIESPNTT